MKLLNKLNISLLIVIIVYSLLTLICMNHGYFWDNIQQISKEAHWFYLTDFSTLLMPAPNSGAEIIATGYHPPLMGIMTAALWKIFGYKLWVSHVFVFLWFAVLIYNLNRIINRFFEKSYAGWISLIVLLESTLLTQFAIASPDFVLFTAFVISLRAILERKKVLLAVGIFFLCMINMRGVFVGAILYFCHNYFIYLQSPKKLDINQLAKTAIPYLPTIIILIAYFSYYLTQNGWFFDNSSTQGHYSMPNGSGRIFKHLAEFILRSIENGRIIIWIIAISITVFTSKKRLKISTETKFLLSIFTLLTALYLVFVLITQMPFSARYFMPQFFVLTILAMYGLTKVLKERNIKIIFLLVICFELTGNLWIYPDKIAKSWDCTLAHLPYYELRKDCFKYIDQQKINYNNISSGFCLYGNRQFVELKNPGKIIGTELDRKYFIYSNISNIEDGFAEDLRNVNLWIPIKRFEKGFVYITIYERKWKN